MNKKEFAKKVPKENMWSKDYKPKVGSNLWKMRQKREAMEKMSHEEKEKHSKEVMKNWPSSHRASGMKAQMKRTEENKKFQKETGRAWNE